MTDITYTEWRLDDFSVHAQAPPPASGTRRSAGTPRPTGGTARRRRPSRGRRCSGRRRPSPARPTSPCARPSRCTSTASSPTTVRARPRRLSALSIVHSNSSLYYSVAVSCGHPRRLTVPVSAVLGPCSGRGLQADLDALRLRGVQAGLWPRVALPFWLKVTAVAVRLPFKSLRNGSQQQSTVV